MRREAKNRRRLFFQRIIHNLRLLGFEIREISPYTYRINDFLDICPANKSFHNILTGEKGRISDESDLKSKLGVLRT